MTVAPPADPLRAVLLDPGEPARDAVLDGAPRREDGPLVSCIMASRGLVAPAAHAIACFARQTHGPRELVIACATPGSAVARFVAGRPDIRLVEVPAAATVGALRNAAIAAARGSLLCVWDDDDLSHPQRLAWQLAALRGAGAAACMLSRVLLWSPGQARLAVSANRLWENSLLVRRDAIGLYPDVTRGGDTVLVRRLRASTRIVAIDKPVAYCYTAHAANLWSQPHFDRLFANATEHFPGAAYTAALAQLGRDMPMADYAAGP